MLSGGRGGAAGWVSLFSSRADMRAHMSPFLLLQPSECSHALEQRLVFAFPSCIPAPHPFLLRSSPPERSKGCSCPTRPLRKEKSPWPGQCQWGRAPRPTGGSLAWLVSGEYRCSLSNLGSSRGAKEPRLSGPDAEPGPGTATFTLNHWQVPGGTGESSALHSWVDGADVCLAVLVCPALVLAGSSGLPGARSSCLWGMGRGLQPKILQLRRSFVPGTGGGSHRGTTAVCSLRTWWTGRSPCCGRWATWGRSTTSGCTSLWIGPSASSTRISSSPSPRRRGEPPGVCTVPCPVPPRGGGGWLTTGGG